MPMSYPLRNFRPNVNKTKMCLMIPKPDDASRRTDNTIANRKRTKDQTMMYKALHRKRKIEQREPY